MEAELRNWSACYDNKKKSPHFHLAGEIYNDGRFVDGKRIYTSRIVSIIDNIATTKSGTKYILGHPYQYLYDMPQDVE